MRFRAYLDFHGDTHVHRDDCADLKRLRGSQHDQPYEIGYELPDGADTAAQDAAARAIAQEIYDDQIKEGMDADSATEYVTYAPCTTIPNGVGAAAQDAAPAPRSVIHLPAPGTRGHSVENHERRARGAMAEGYAVAPEPIDGREHEISRRGLQPCPACSALDERA